MAAVVARANTSTPHDGTGVACHRPRRLNGSHAHPPPPAKRPKLDSLEKETALELRKKHVAPSLSLHYSSVRPLKIVYGRGQYLYDEQDQPYLDCINNVTHVGHCHPEVVAAGTEQVSRLVHLRDSAVVDRYTQHLLSTFPDNMGHVFYVHSGTEANDLALLIAKTVTSHSEVIVIDGYVQYRL
jgi:ethanolamine-phosphate phospho-lyase